MAELGYEANIDQDVKEYREGFTVIPPGWAKVVIVASEVVVTQSGGKMLVLDYEVQGGSGGTFKDRLNIMNKSERAQTIGRAALAKIAQSIGHKGAIADSKVLHGRPFEVKIEIEEFKSNKADDNGEYPMLKSNKAGGYRAVQAAAVKAPAEKGEPVGW